MIAGLVTAIALMIAAKLLRLDPGIVAMGVSMPFCVIGTVASKSLPIGEDFFTAEQKEAAAQV